MEKILTISVAAYNAAKDLPRCLASMLETEVAELLEIIIVNDGSKDDTLTAAEELRMKAPDIVKVIDKKNGGHGSTINASIVEATGKYFKIVDSDDWVDKEGLEKLVRWLKDNDADLVLNPYHEVDEKTMDRRALKDPRDIAQTAGEIKRIETAKDLTLYMHSITWNTRIMKKMGPAIDEHCFYVDLEYAIFPMPLVKNYICFDYPVYQYLLGSVSQSVTIGNMIKRRDQHLKVVKRITGSYHDFKDGMTDSVKTLVRNRVRWGAVNQYKIYANMDPKEAAGEVKAFDSWLKKADEEIYEGPGGKFMAVMKLQRSTGFGMYGLSIRMIRALGISTAP